MHLRCTCNAETFCVSQCGPGFVCIRFNCTNMVLSVMVGARKNMKLLSCMFAGGTAR